MAGRCWLFADYTLQTWAQASQTCIRLGGHLAVEYDTNIQYSLAREAAQRGGTWWVGLRRSFQAEFLQGKLIQLHRLLEYQCQNYALKII